VAGEGDAADSMETDVTEDENDATDYNDENYLAVPQNL